MAKIEIMSWFIVGDSIAVGLAGALRGCKSNAKEGISSAEVIARVPSAYYDFVAISAGSNDPDNPSLRFNLETIRKKVNAGRVVWVLPANKTASDAVMYVAYEHGDGTVAIEPGHDNIHPHSYHTLAAAVLKAGAS